MQNEDNDNCYAEGDKITDKSVFKWKNPHPTLKPISLNNKILKLFKTPNEQKIAYPFAGVGSEIIGGINADFKDWIGCEINQDYIDIANARIRHFTGNQLKNFEPTESVVGKKPVETQLSLF